MSGGILEYGMDTEISSLTIYTVASNIGQLPADIIYLVMEAAGGDI